MPGTFNVLEWLEESARRLPDKAAFSDEDASYSFEGTLDVARRVGSALAMRYRARNMPFAVLVDRDADSLCCLLGVVASGNFYVPIDVTQPAMRIKAMLDQMQPAALIQVRGNAPAALDGLISIDVLEYSELRSAEVDAAALDAIRAESVDTDPLYAICTSGTTGTPKGVLVSHRSVLDFIPVFAETFGFGESEVFANQAPFDFDVSVKDIYSTLYCAASMHVVPRKCFTMPKLLPQMLEDCKATTIIWAVSALSVVAGLKAFKYQVPSSLRNVLFSGEVMPVKHLKYWQECLPRAVFVNLYGPTEITCNCMYYIVDREFSDDERLPLGVPFPNEKVVVLDEKNAEIGPGSIGEICVMGTCLGLGYYRDPERTSQAFVQNPLNTRYRETMYRTGDLARYNERGELVYASRKDFQIKHMGHRIELEEIEAHLNAVEGVERACCLFDEGRNKIVACIAGDRSSREMALALGEKLPKYMIPNVFHTVVPLPITKNGKIDRNKLKSEYAS